MDRHQPRRGAPFAGHAGEIRRSGRHRSRRRARPLPGRPTTGALGATIRANRGAHRCRGRVGGGRRGAPRARRGEHRQQRLGRARRGSEPPFHGADGRGRQDPGGLGAERYDQRRQLGHLVRLQRGVGVQRDATADGGRVSSRADRLLVRTRGDLHLPGCHGDREWRHRRQSQGDGDDGQRQQLRQGRRAAQLDDRLGDHRG